MFYRHFYNFSKRLFLRVQLNRSYKFCSNFMPIPFNFLLNILYRSKVAFCVQILFSTKLHPGTNRATRNFLLSDYNEPNKRIIELKCKIFYKRIKFIEYITFQYEENMVRKNNFNMDVVVRDAIDYIVESKTVCNVNISKQTFA